MDELEIIPVSMEMVDEWCKGSKEAKGYLMEFFMENKDNQEVLIPVVVTIRDTPALRGKNLKFFFKKICSRDMNVVWAFCKYIPSEIIAEAVETGNKQEGRAIIVEFLSKLYLGNNEQEKFGMN